MARTPQLLSPELRALLKKHPLPKRTEGDRILRGDLAYGAERYASSATAGESEHWPVYLALESELGHEPSLSVKDLPPPSRLSFARFCLTSGRSDLGLAGFRAYLADPRAELSEADVVDYLAEVENVEGKGGMVKAADELLPRMQSERVLLMCVQAAASLGDVAGAQERLAKFGNANSTLPGLLRAEHFLPKASAPAADAPDTVAMAVPPSLRTASRTPSPPPPPLEIAPKTVPAPNTALAPATPAGHRSAQKTGHPVIGQLVGGRFQIDGFVAEGRVAQVFAAMREGTPRHVALKVLLPAFAQDKDVAQRFLAALEQARALEHPGIVPVFACGVDRGWLFGASEMVFGGNLDSFVEPRGPLPPREALRITIDVTRALAYALGRGVVHGGLRPSNVLVSLRYDAPDLAQFRVTDFGMADVDRSMVTFDGNTAPERLFGTSANPAMDVYGVATLLYQLLTGDKPFQHVSATRLEHAVMHDVLPRPTGQVPAQLVSLMGRCLRKNPAERPADARALLRDLEGIERALDSVAAVRTTQRTAPAPDDTQTKLRREATPAPGAHPLVGQELDGRFRVVSYMRSGGMAQLYYGTQTQEPSRVAIKVMHPHFAREPEVVRRFAQEARLAAKLDHPNIVRLIHVGDDPRLLYYAMELLRGEDLSVRLKQRGRMAESQATDIGIAVARALAYAHGLGVVHRDIKPGNVMFSAIDEREQVKLLDFGIAKVLDQLPGSLTSSGVSSHRSAITVAGDLVGTPRYMSPEQGRAQAVDHRADLYSLGVVLYELVTGVVPFDGETALQIIARHVQDQPRPPSSLADGLHPGLERVILELLQKTPEKRPSSALEVAQALEALSPQLSSSPATSTHRWMEDSKSSGPRTVIPTRDTPPSASHHGAEDDDLPTRANELRPTPAVVELRTVAMAATPHAGVGAASPMLRAPAPATVQVVAAAPAPPAGVVPAPPNPALTSSPAIDARPKLPATMVAATNTARMMRDNVMREAARFMVPPPEDAVVATLPDAQVPPRDLAREAQILHERERRAMQEQITRLYRIVQVLIGLVVVALVAVVIVVMLK